MKEEYYWIKSDGSVQKITKEQYKYYEEIYEDGVIEGEHVRLVVKKTESKLYVVMPEWTQIIPIKALKEIIK